MEQLDNRPPDARATCSAAANTVCTSPSKGRSAAKAAAVVFVFGLVAYAGGLRNGFAFDDALVIREARLLREPHAESFVSAEYFDQSRESTWRPLVTLTYVVDYAVSGERAWAYHAQSLLWHLVASVLVLALARHLAPVDAVGRRAATWSAVLFAVHPVASEAVYNAGLREDVLATAFGLTAILLAFRNTRFHLALALAAYAAALLAKENAIVVPVLLAGVRWASANAPRPRSQRWSEVIAFSAVTGVYLVARFGPFRSPPGYAEYAGGTLAATLVGMPQILVHYLRLLVLPWPLCPDYLGVFRFGRDAVSTLAWALPVLGAVVGGALWLARRNRICALGAAWFAVALAPVSNLVPLPVPAAERFLYLPLVGVALVVLGFAVGVAPSFPLRARWIGAGAAGLLVAALVVLTNLRQGAWRDNFTLWSTTVRAFPSAYVAHSGLGSAYMDRGDTARAVEEMELALRLGPRRGYRGSIATNLAVAYAALGRHDDAFEMLRRAAADRPSAENHFNLGIAYIERGELDLARATLAASVRLDPSRARAHALLAYAWWGDDRPQAIELLARARALAVDDPGVDELGRMLEDLAPGDSPRFFERPPKEAAPESARARSE